MFISNAEKSMLDARISYLEGKVQHHADEINLINQFLERFIIRGGIKRGWTPEKRAAQSERMKKAWADKKAKQ
jgi:hypothetical protein